MSRKFWLGYLLLIAITLLLIVSCSGCSTTTAARHAEAAAKVLQYLNPSGCDPYREVRWTALGGAPRECSR